MFCWSHLSQSPHFSWYPERRLASFVCITSTLPHPSALCGDSVRFPSRQWALCSNKKIVQPNICLLLLWALVLRWGSTNALHSSDGLSRYYYTGERTFVLLFARVTFSRFDFCWVTSKHVEKLLVQNCGLFRPNSNVTQFSFIWWTSSNQSFPHLVTMGLKIPQLAMLPHSCFTLLSWS